MQANFIHRHFLSGSANIENLKKEGDLFFFFQERMLGMKSLTEPFYRQKAGKREVLCKKCTYAQKRYIVHKKHINLLFYDLFSISLDIQ